MNNMRTKWAINAATLTLCAALSQPSYGGSLTPPPGPIQSTDRVTLNEQFITLPFTISQPGSYVLTSNLTGVVGQDGIRISANGVTLDLNGFQLAGVPGSGHGIAFLGIAVTGVTIVNGSIAGWGGDGINGLNAFPLIWIGCAFSPA